MDIDDPKESDDQKLCDDRKVISQEFLAFQNQKVSSSFDGLVFQETFKLRLNLKFKKSYFSFIYGSISDTSESGYFSIIRVIVFHLGTVPTAHSPPNNLCIVFRILEVLETYNWTLVNDKLS